MVVMDTIYFKQLTLKASVSASFESYWNFPSNMGNGYFFHFFDLVHSTLPANISLNFQPILKILAVLKSLAKTLLKSRFSHQSEHFYCLWWTNTKKGPKNVKIPYKFGSFFRIFDLWCGYYSGGLSAKWFQITLILYKCRPKKMLHRNLKVPGTLVPGAQTFSSQYFAKDYTQK